MFVFLFVTFFSANTKPPLVACTMSSYTERMSFMVRFGVIPMPLAPHTRDSAASSSSELTESEHETGAFSCACQKHFTLHELSKEIDNMNHNYTYPVFFQTTSQFFYPCHILLHFLLYTVFCCLSAAFSFLPSL